MASVSLLLLHLLLIFSTASAWPSSRYSHYYRFYGGSVNFRPSGRNSAGYYEVELHDKQATHYCDQHNSYRCSSGICGSGSGSTKSSTSWNSYGLRWCQYETVTKREINVNLPFEISFPTSRNSRYGRGYWARNIRSSMSVWKMKAHVDLGLRSDTGESNKPPVFTMLPLLRVPRNCPRSFNMTLFDPDGDRVRCRIPTTSTKYECAMCGLPKGFILDKSSCSLTYKSSSRTGVHPFELMVEDFPNKSIKLDYSNGYYTVKYTLPLGRRKRAATIPTSTAHTTTHPTTAPFTTTTTHPTTAPFTTTTAHPTTAPFTTTTTHPTTAPFTTTTAHPTTAPFTTTTAHPTTAPFTTTTAHPTTAPFTTTAAHPTTAPFTTTTTHPTTAPFTTTTAHPTTAPFTTTTAHPTTAPFTTTTAHPTTAPFTTTTAHPTTAPTTSTTAPTTSTTASTTSTTAPTTTTTTHPTTAPFTTTTTHPTTAPTTSTTAPTTSTTAPTTSTTAPTTTPWPIRWPTSSTTAPTTSTTVRTYTPWPIIWPDRWQTSSTTAPTTTRGRYIRSIRPLSQLPLQFSIYVDGYNAPTCLDGDYFPIFLSPTPANGVNLPAFVNRTLEFKVRSTAQFTTITGLILTGPKGISKQKVSAKSPTAEYLIKWKPTDNELNGHFPICFVSEAKDKRGFVFQSELRCVIVDVGSHDTKVTCNETAIMVEVKKSDLIRRNEDILHLNDYKDSSCNLTRRSNKTHVVAMMSLNTCGTLIEEDDDNIIFKNEITSADPKEIISRKHDVEIVFWCAYPKRTNLTLGFKHKNPYAFTENGFGSFTFQFEFFESQRFKKQRDPSSYPVEVNLKEMMFMQIEATTSIPNTELFVESCRATPYDNPKSRISYTIIDNGCVKDNTVQIYPSSKSQFRFGMEAFEFIGAHEKVYITCSVLLCETGVSGTRCSQGCIGPNSKNRLTKRAAAAQTSSHSISQGPLHMAKASDIQASGPSLNLGMNLIFIVGSLLVCGVVVYQSRRSRAKKYQLLPTDED